MFEAGATMSLPLSLRSDLRVRTQGLRSGSVGSPSPSSDLRPGIPCFFTPGCAEHRKPRPAAGPGQGAMDGPPPPLPATEYLTCETLLGPAGGCGRGGG